MRPGPAIGIVVAALVIVVGVVYFMTHGAASPSETATTTPPAATTTSDYYDDVSSWQAYRDDTDGYTIAYPLDFETDAAPSPAPSNDWRLNAGGNPGTLSFTLTVPAAFEPQTNFVDATLTVGESGNDAAVADCLTPDPTGDPAAATSTATIGGTTFTVFHASDAGAGNLYDSTSYRTLHAGKCYAIEYTIHSSQLANYPASYHLTAFDEAKATALLDRIVGTFSFL